MANDTDAKVSTKKTQKKKLSRRKLTQGEIKKMMPSIVQSLERRGGNKASVELKTL